MPDVYPPHEADGGGAFDLGGVAGGICWFFALALVREGEDSVELFDGLGCQRSGARERREECESHCANLRIKSVSILVML
jgi:hypothetical protein